MEKSSGAKPLLNLPLGKATLGGAGLAGLAGIAAIPGGLSALLSPQFTIGAGAGAGAGGLLGAALGKKLGRGMVLPGLAGAGLGGVGGYKAIDSTVGDRSNLDQFLMAYGGMGSGGLASLLHLIARRKNPARTLLENLPSHAAISAGGGIGGTIGTAKALDAYRSKEAKLIKKASVAADGMNKEAFAKLKELLTNAAQKTGIMRTPKYSDFITGAHKSPGKRNFAQRIANAMISGPSRNIEDALALGMAAPLATMGAPIGAVSAGEGNRLAGAASGAVGGASMPILGLMLSKYLNRAGQPFLRRNVLGAAGGVGGGAVAGTSMYDALT